jgi:retinol dehydrogenase-12
VCKAPVRPLISFFSPVVPKLTLEHSARKKASHIILACRNLSKGQEAIESIVSETKCTPHTTLEVWTLDLSSYASVLSFTSRVNKDLPRLDFFVANAGMELQTYRTAESLEIHLTVNVVSTFLCAIAILPKLRSTSDQYSVDTTLTFCGSMYHIFGPDAEFDHGLAEDVDMFDALSTPDPAQTDIVWRYALSKLMVHLCFHALIADLSRKSEYSNVIVNLINPGWCGTELSRAKPHPLGERVCFAVMGWSAEKGSRMYLNALAKGREGHGRYLSESEVKSESAFVRSERGGSIQRKMWRDLVKRMERVAPDVAAIVS